MANLKAQWSISLDCECPNCTEPLNIADEVFSNEIQVGEHDTERSKDYEITCPYCEWEFKVDFEF
jgi:hypothetical protein